MGITAEQAMILSKNYSNKVGSRIQSTSYDYNTGELTFDTVDGQWIVPVNSGMTVEYKNTLDNISYANDTLKVNGEEVLTKADEVSNDDNIDFGGWFD